MCFLLFFGLVNGLSFPWSAGSIKGRVTNDEGMPLANIKVEAQNTTIATQTLSDGTFLLEGLELGKHQLVFTHPDYMEKTLEILIDEKPVRLIEVFLSAKNPMLLTIKEEITVTAEADSIIDVNLPSHRTILPSSVLTELGTANVAEAVEKAPGVAMVGKGGYSMVPSIRGVAENRILLLVDGIQITSERRIGASASFIGLNNIDRIEVNRGPYSVIHGSGAIGGIINIVTKSPAANAPFSGNVRLGYNTVKEEGVASVNLSGSRGKFGFMLAANGKKAGDYSSPAGKIEQSHYSDYDIFLKANRTGENSLVYFTFLNYKGLDIGKPSPSARLKPRWYPKERNALFALGYKVQDKFHLDALNVSFYFFLPALETQKDNLTDSLVVKKRNLAKVESTNFGFKIRGGKGLGRIHTLNFGFDFFGHLCVNDSNTEWNFDESGQIAGRKDETSLQDARRNNFGVFIDDKIQISSSVIMNLGARFDYISTSNLTDSSARATRSDRSISAYIGSIFQMTPHLSFLANLGRSFRFPTISELFYTGLTGRGTVFGNENLKPEISVNLDFGFRYLHEKFYASVYGFSNSVSDLIEKYGGAGEEEYRYRNLGQGRITGIEGELYFFIAKDLEFFVNFHHIKGKDKETRAALNYIPPSRITCWTKYSLGKFWLEPKVALTAAMKDPGPLETEIDGYMLLETILGFKANKNLMVIAIAQNILNQTCRWSADEEGVEAPGRGFVFKVSFSF